MNKGYRFELNKEIIGTFLTQLYNFHINKQLSDNTIDKILEYYITLSDMRQRNNYHTDNNRLSDIKVTVAPWESMIIPASYNKLISSPLMLKQEGNKQLAFCDNRFVSGTHSRFSHMLGVYYLAERALKQIKRNSADLYKESRGYFKEFLCSQKTNNSISNVDLDSVDKVIENSFLLSALIHDIYHGPLGHSMEMVSRCALGPKSASK